MHATRSRAWLLLPAVVVWSADVALTLMGQPDGYWRGDYGLAVEANPLMYPLLVCSPWVFVAVALGWCVAFSAIVLMWTRRAGEWVAVLVTIGHLAGGASWLARLGAVGWVFVVLYLVTVTLGIRWCWRRA